MIADQGNTVTERTGNGQWHRVAKRQALSEDMPVAAEIDGVKVGVFLANGRLFAVENVCPHAFALLTDGFVDGDVVECPLHAATFDLKTGKHLLGPCDRGIATYDVRVEDDVILVRL